MILTANRASGPDALHEQEQGIGAKLLRVMKLTTIVMLAFCLHTSAKGVAQQTITFSGKEVSLENVFNAIKKQTSYRFFFNTDAIPRTTKVTIDVKNAPIEQVMHLALKDQPLTFAIKGRTIFIMKKVGEDKSSLNVEMSGDPVTVSGKVTDDQGQPLVGANVKVKGSNAGVTTDNQGRFTLPNVDPNATLEISFVGHETQVLSVKGKTVFMVALGQRQSILDETVVIAYGTTSRRFTTGNVASVKANDIEKQPVQNPLLALQGRVPGVFITQSTGLPGSGITVRIQGINSIGKGNDPLYVIDGIPYSSQLLPNLGSVLGGSGGFPQSQSGNGNPLSYINVSDIESIDILKDADATSIYGSRAANGAILITTKKGKAGQTKVSINLLNGWGKITRKLKLLNSHDYLMMRNEAKMNDNVAIAATDYDINGAWDTTRYTDWQKELIGGTAKYTDIQSTISGGNETTQFIAGAGYHKETTVFPGDMSDQKASLHFKINNVSSNQRFHFQLSANYLRDNNRLIVSDLTGIAIQLAPIAPRLYNDEGTLNWEQTSSGTSTWTNPLRFLYSKYLNRTDNLVSNSILSYMVLPGLEIKSSFGYTNQQVTETTVSPLLARAPETRANSIRTAGYTQNSVSSWIIEPQITYKLVLGKGKLEALLGSSIQESQSKGQILTGSGYNSDFVLEDIKSAASISVFSSVSSLYKYNAVFGRLNYNLLEKYILDFTARRDGSSRFGSENLFHDFWGASFGWIFSKERVIEKNIPSISFGKIRGSYGTTGNDQIGDYQFMNLYSAISATVPYQGVSGSGVNSLWNPYLQWEETRKLQFGLDLGFLRDKILFTTNYFFNRSSNQLLQYSLPIITGFPFIRSNFPATVQNSGWEFSLSTTNFSSSSITWSSFVNLTFPKNKLVGFQNLESSSYASQLIVGEPITVTKAFHFIGTNPTTGIYEFQDINGNATSSPNSLVDKYVLINTLPKFFGGVQNKFNVKNFELDFLFQFVKQVGANNLFGNSTIPGRFNGTGSLGNQPISVIDRWQKPGDITTIQKFNSNSSLSSQFDNARSSDAGYSDASFVRLKNISLSWQVPSSWCKKIKLQSCRLYTQGQNLLTITKYHGMDPENQSAVSLPPLRVLTMGVQIMF